MSHQPQNAVFVERRISIIDDDCYEKHVIPFIIVLAGNQDVDHMERTEPFIHDT